MASLVGDTLYKMLSEQSFTDPMNMTIITFGTQNGKRRIPTLMEMVCESLNFPSGCMVRSLILSAHSHSGG